MSGIRWCLRLIALIILLDFCITTVVQGDGRSALVPPLVGSIVASLMCWQDAASSGRRRLVTILSAITSVCVALGFVLTLTQPSMLQTIVLAILFAASLVVTARSWSAMRKRRMRYAGYLVDGNSFVR